MMSRSRCCTLLLSRLSSPYCVCPAASIARSLAFSPYADMLWMETKTPMLAEAKQFAEGVHAVFPHAMLAYNLSPSFNWSAAGLGDDDIQKLQTELGRLGFW